MTMKLKELRHQRAKLHDQWKALIAKEGEMPAGEELPAEDITAIDDLKSQITALDARISRVEDMLSSDADNADNVDPGAETDDEKALRMANRKSGPALTPHGYGEQARTEGKGFKMARMMIGIAMAKSSGFSAAATAIERRFGDKDVAKALNTSGVATGGALIPQSFLADIIELLRAASVVRACEPMIVDMPGGNLTIPRLASGATAAWQGELDDVGVSQETFDDLQLNAKKLTAMVPVSNDLIRRTPMNVEMIIRDDLVQTSALKEDLAFLLSDGSISAPIGLYNLAAAANKLIAVAFTDNTNATILTQVVGVLQGMMATLKQNMSRMIRVRWIMPVGVESFLMGLRDGVGNFVYMEEMLTGKLLGFPYKVTQQLATNLNTGTVGSPVNNGSYIFLADFADVIIGETLDYRVDIADQASYTTGGSTVSAFQRDQTVFRAIKEVDFNLRHQASVVVAQLPGWLPAGFTAAGGSAFYVQAPSNDMSAAPSTWGAAAPTGSNNPANIAANAPGGTQPGRP